MVGLRLLRWASVVLLLAACGEEVAQSEAPGPQEVSREAIGYYCNMIVADHPGPKAQIFLGDAGAPIWFSSVRDAIAFTHLPEEPKNVAAIYVNDMSSGPWEAPAPGNWIDATSAWYVIGSSRRGGMGAPETVPFAERPEAVTFAAEHGGEVVNFDAIPQDYVLGPVSEPAPPGHSQNHGDPAPSQMAPSAIAPDTSFPAQEASQ